MTCSYQNAPCAYVLYCPTSVSKNKKGSLMIRLTVMYNLPPDTDEDDYLAWRLGEHQDNNAAISGVIRTDFARIDETYPRDQKPPYRFMTTADWADRESFEKGFYDEKVQTDLAENLKKITDYVFLISEIMTETRND